MKNITLITSVIDTPNIPLSYINSRTIFNKEQRFEQTKKTISSIRDKIIDSKIFLVECSELTDSERSYFIENVDYFFNIYDTQNKELISRMFTRSKSMGEGTMTIIALNYLIDNSIEFDNFFKISGRYWLNDNFNYDLYNNQLSCIHKIHNDNDNAFTCFYKLSKQDTSYWLNFLLNSVDDFVKCIGFEFIFANFLKNHSFFTIENKVGIHGYVSVCGTFIDL